MGEILKEVSRLRGRLLRLWALLLVHRRTLLHGRHLGLSLEHRRSVETRRLQSVQERELLLMASIDRQWTWQSILGEKQACSRCLRL